MAVPTRTDLDPADIARVTDLAARAREASRRLALLSRADKDGALRAMADEGLAVLETTPQAQEAYRDLIAEKSRDTVWLAGGCASWYLDKHGHNTTLWPDFTFRFRRLTRTLDRENYVGTPARVREVAA